MDKKMFAIYVNIILHDMIQWCNTDDAPATGQQSHEEAQLICCCFVTHTWAAVLKFWRCFWSCEKSLFPRIQGGIFFKWMDEGNTDQTEHLPPSFVLYSKLLILL